jgi:UDPglucose 6-dehydrogenase
VTELADRTALRNRLCRAFVSQHAEGSGGEVTASAPGVGEALAFQRDVDAINLRCRARTVDLALGLAVGSLASPPVSVLGAAFKPNSDDTQDSPVLVVATAVHGLGARVTIYDTSCDAQGATGLPRVSIRGLGDGCGK